MYEDLSHCAKFRKTPNWGASYGGGTAQLEMFAFTDDSYRKPACKI